MSSEQKRGFRYWRGLRRAPQMAKEMWAASRSGCLAILTCRLLAATFPVALLAVGGLLIDAINNIQKHGGDLRKVWLLLGIEALLMILSDALIRLAAHCDLIVTNRFTLQLNLRLIRHCNNLDLETFESSQFQDRLERAKAQISSQVALLRGLLQVAEQTVSVIGLVMGAFLLAPGLIAVQLLGVLPVVIAEGRFSLRRYRIYRGRTASKRLLEYFMSIATSPQSAKEVKLFTLGSFLSERYARIGETYNREDHTLSIQQNLASSVFLLLSTAVYYGAYAVLIFRTSENLLSIGRLIFLSGLLERTKWQLTSLFGGFSRSLDQLMSVNDVFEVFDERPRLVASARREVPRNITRGIEFRHVSFSYAGSSESVLHDVSFRIAPGERIALVGPNGAGKTTIIKLLMRLYDPTAGQILLDGSDIREFDPEQFRNRITAVFQDYTKYDLSVGENIGLGDADRVGDGAAVERAATEAGAADLIARLPAKYRQILGKRFADGVELSGGEWQRIALARACMRKAEIFILDEPSSAMDARAEAALFHDFSKLVEGRMAVLISHRFSTVRMADRILVLEKGRIREQGSHEELLAGQGEYAQLFELQAAGYR